jgi:DMSO/TMAO reductase YedYZ molybdopterin-dependent catalytic subunit
MATTKEEGAVPNFLRMDQPVSSAPANAKKTGNWYGWPTKEIKPVTLVDDEGRTVRIRTPVMDLEGLLRPTHLHYTVQYDKGLPMQKALHPDTILAWAQNGQLLEHLHGAPVRLLVPGWSGNWSVKWLNKLEVLEKEPNCWYHYQFYYYGNSPDDPHKELITTIGVKSIVTQPNDDTETLSPGVHMIRGYAWSGAGAIDQVEVSVDGGETWQFAHLEQPRDRFIWVRWSCRWDVRQKGKYILMSRATDEVGRVQSREPRYNHMRKNFSAIVGYPVTVE